MNFIIFILAFLNPAFAQPLGNPLYVLEQAEQISPQSETSVWEVRLPDYDQNQMFSGSRRLFSKKGMQLRSFAFAGFEITDEKIETSALYLLSGDGNLWVCLDKFEQRYLNEKMKLVAKNLTLLEKGAENILFAVQEGNTLLTLDQKGKSTVLASRAGLGLHDGEVIQSITRENETTLWLATSLSRIIRINTASPANPLVEHIALPPTLSLASLGTIHTDGEVLWILSPNAKELIRYDRINKKVHRHDISGFYQNVQDGSKFEFLTAKEGVLFGRVGVHVYEFSAPVFGTKLTSKAVMADFFGEGLRAFGIQYSLHGTNMSLRPRLAETNALRRFDVKVRQSTKFQPLNPLKLPLEVSAPLVLKRSKMICENYLFPKRR